VGVEGCGYCVDDELEGIVVLFVGLDVDEVDVLVVFGGVMFGLFGCEEFGGD